jgi:nuclear pore complex protein Nup98-Nup96
MCEFIDDLYMAGGPNPASPQQPATGGIFGQSQQTTVSSSPFGTATTGFGQAATPNPFAASSTPNLFGGAKPTFGSPSTPAPTFGAASTPAFGSTPFGSSTPAFGAGSSTPAFGSTPSPFGQSSASAFGGSTFGSTTPSLFGQTTPAFGASSPAFGAASSSPAFGSQNSSPFGGSSIFGSTQTSAAGGLFSTPASQPFGTTNPVFGQSQPAFGSNLFSNTTTPGSIFGQTKPAGLAQSSVCNVSFDCVAIGFLWNSVQAIHYHSWSNWKIF